MSRASCLGLLAGVVGLVALQSGLDYAWQRVDRWRFPWGYTDTGRPALAGPWVGTLVTGGGARLGLFVEIRMQPINTVGRRGRRHVRSDRYSKLAGEARVCWPDRTMQRFELYGDNDDAAAARFHLALLLPEGSTPRDGLQPSHLRGRWDGRDAVVLDADVHLRRGASAVSDTADPDTGRPARAEMRRGGEPELQALCAILGR